MVLTSHGKLGDTGRKTGFWLEGLAAPYYAFRDAGAEIVMASPKGAQPPLDPRSNEPASQTDLTRRFERDADAMTRLTATVRLDAIRAGDFDAVFYPGGHGPLWDLAEDPTSIALIEGFLAAGKPLSLVGHAPAALRHVKTTAGRPLVQGRRVTSFTNSEEDAIGLAEVAPFLVENELVRLGALFEKVADFAALVVEDGQLITGQNAASSGPTARALMARLRPG